MFTKENLIVDYPAYAIYKTPEWRQAKMIDEMEFALPFESRSHGIQYHFFKLGSVIGSAVRNGDDPLAALERAKGFGHNLHFAFPLAVVIHNGPKEKANKIALNWGDVIGFHGKRFKLVKAPNDNVSLVEVE